MTTIKKLSDFFEIKDNTVQVKNSDQNLSTVSKTRGAFSWFFGRLIGGGAIRCKDGNLGTVYLSRDAFNEWKTNWIQEHKIDKKLSSQEFLDKVQLEILEKSATLNDPKAQFALGKAYEEGLKVKKDPAKAYDFYRLAGEHGNVDALLKQAHLLKIGRGVKKDLQEAVLILKKAAGLESDEACYQLGVAYEDGVGTEQDLEKAVENFKLAADRGDARAQYKLGLLLKSGKGVETNKEEAFEYFKKAVENKFVPAFAELGRCYMEGIGCEKDIRQGKTFIAKGTHQDDADPEALYLYELYKIGIMFEGQFFLLAANKGHAKAALEVLKIYSQLPTNLNGIKNSKAFYLEIAASSGDPSASLRLAQRKSGEEKIAILTRSAKNSDHPDVCFALGEEYSKGDNVEKNEKTALEYFKRAANKGHATAKTIVGYATQGHNQDHD